MATEIKDGKAATSKRYVVINSAHLTKQLLPSDSRAKEGDYQIHINDPIRDAYEMSMLTFTMPNEIVNIVTGVNDEFHIVYRHCTSVNPDMFWWAYAGYVIPEGLYTLPRLVDAMNEAVTALPLTRDPPDHLQSIRQPHFIYGSSGSDGLSYFGMQWSEAEPALTSPDDTKSAFYPLALSTEPYRHSIWHRLGIPEWRVITYIPYVGDLAEIFHLKTNNIENKVYAPTRGYENFDAIQIHVDQVAGSVQSTVMPPSGVSGYSETTRADLLAQIPINVNIGSLLHWTRPEPGHMNLPMNPRQAITNLNIRLSDDTGRVFKLTELPQWSMIIEFKLIEHDTKQADDLKLKNAQMAYTSRHAPISI